MRVILSGGGTAGHIYPALAVAGLLRANGHEVHFIGTPAGIEARLVAAAGVDFIGVPARGFDRSRPLSLLVGVAVALVSAVRCTRILSRLRPDVVVGFGGYVSIPVGLASRILGRPLVLHEQNSVPGLANRTISRWASVACVTYENSTRFLKHPERAIVTGNPVREDVLSAHRDQGRVGLGIPDDATLLLVFGGSRGARHINQAVLAGAKTILHREHVHILHVAGPLEVDSVRQAISSLAAGLSDRYHVVGYLEDMGGAMAGADLIVARAGATSLAEITALGRAAVLVPYPYATDDHQTTNAQAVTTVGGAELVADADLDSPEFIEKVTRLLEDASARATMADASKSLGRPDAARSVVDTIERVALSSAEKENT